MCRSRNKSTRQPVTVRQGTSIHIPGRPPAITKRIEQFLATLILRLTTVQCIALESQPPATSPDILIAKGWRRRSPVARSVGGRTESPADTADGPDDPTSPFATNPADAADA